MPGLSRPLPGVIRCSNPSCLPSDETQQWIECENCFPLWHFDGAKISDKAADFYCTECTMTVNYIVNLFKCMLPLAVLLCLQADEPVGNFLEQKL